MKKSITRLVCLFLIPCLIADPLMARGLGVTVCTPSVRRAVASPAMDTAAFAAIPVWMHLTRLKYAYRYRRMAGGRRAKGMGYAPGTHDPKGVGVAAILFDRMGWPNYSPSTAFVRAFADFQGELRDQGFYFEDIALIGLLRDFMIGSPVDAELTEKLSRFVLKCIALHSGIRGDFKIFERPYLARVYDWLARRFPEFQGLQLESVGDSTRLHFTANPGTPWERKIHLELIHSDNREISSAHYFPLPSSSVPEYLVQLQLIAAESTDFIEPFEHELRETAWRARGYNAAAAHKRAELGLWPTEKDVPGAPEQDESVYSPGASHRRAQGQSAMALPDGAHEKAARQLLSSLRKDARLRERDVEDAIGVSDGWLYQIQHRDGPPITVPLWPAEDLVKIEFAPAAAAEHHTIRTALGYWRQEPLRVRREELTPAEDGVFTTAARRIEMDHEQDALLIEALRNALSHFWVGVSRTANYSPSDGRDHLNFDRLTLQIPVFFTLVRYHEGVHAAIWRLFGAPQNPNERTIRHIVATFKEMQYLWTGFKRQEQDDLLLELRRAHQLNSDDVFAYSMLAVALGELRPADWLNPESAMRTVLKILFPQLSPRIHIPGSVRLLRALDTNASRSDPSAGQADLKEAA